MSKLNLRKLHFIVILSFAISILSQELNMEIAAEVVVNEWEIKTEMRLIHQTDKENQAQEAGENRQIEKLCSEEQRWELGLVAKITNASVASENHVQVQISDLMVAQRPENLKITPSHRLKLVLHGKVSKTCRASREALVNSLTGKVLSPTA
ncbi:MAG: hypothetical protein E6Q83_08275 [Thiothrix sp.]|nr:MAG: hypothetical protein E6Q83_08275 [Thiothrix sp.]